MTMQISSYEDTQLDAVEIPADAPKFEDKNTTVTIGEITGELTKKTLFLQLSFSLLGSERTSQGTEQDIKTTADKQLLKVKKQLFKSPAYSKIKSIDAQLRRRVDKLCVRGALKSVRTVPNRNVGKVFDLCVKHEVLRTGLIKKFAEIYPTLYADAKAQLGPLHRSDEYPSPEYLAKHPEQYFGFAYDYVTYDVPGALKEIDGHAFLHQVGTRAQRIKSAEEEINRLRRTTFAALLSKLKEELAPGAEGVEKKFSTKAIKKLQKFIAEYDVMDVTSDDELKALKVKCANLIEGVTGDNIKSSENFKNDLLKEVGNLSDLLKPLVEEEGRALRDI